MLFYSGGLCINAFTIYQPYIRLQNGFTNAQSSLLITIRSLSAFVSMLLSGWYFKKFSLRTGTLLGGLSVVVGFALYGVAKTYFLYCVGAVLAGAGYALAGVIPMAMIMERWFHKSRMLAVGLCSAATGLAVVGVPQMLTWMIETFGLMTTFLSEAALMGVLTTVVWLLLRDRPADKGLKPYGAEEEIARTKKQHGRKLEKRSWLLLVPMLLLLGAVNSVAYSHLTMLATAQGFSAQTVATAISVTGITLIGGKCAYGWIAEKWGTCASNWIFGTSLAVGLFFCCVAKGNNLLLFAGTGAYAMGVSLATIGTTAWAGDLASAEQYDRTVQLFQIISTAGALVFSTFPGVLADRFGGSYVPAFVCFTIFAAFVAFSIQWIYYRTKKQENRP